MFYRDYSNRSAREKRFLRYDPNEIINSLKEAEEEFDQPEVINPLARKHFVSLLERFDTLAEENDGVIISRIEEDTRQADITIKLPCLQFDYDNTLRLLLMDVILFADELIILPVPENRLVIKMYFNYFAKTKHDPETDMMTEDKLLRRQKLPQLLETLYEIRNSDPDDYCEY